jgi:putative oxidoreductase
MAYLTFALRIALGGILLVAGGLKAHDGPALTAVTIAGYRILPAALVAPLGVALPYVEMLLGGYLAAGFLTRLAATVAAAQFAIFAVAVASLVLRRIPADCGCFGSGVPTPPSWGHVSVDVALAVCAAFVALRAPGAWALDRRLGTSGSFEPQREG